VVPGVFLALPVSGTSPRVVGVRLTGRGSQGRSMRAWSLSSATSPHDSGRCWSSGFRAQVSRKITAGDWWRRLSWKCCIPGRDSSSKPGVTTTITSNASSTHISTGFFRGPAGAGRRLLEHGDAEAKLLVTRYLPGNAREREGAGVAQRTTPHHSAGSSAAASADHGVADAARDPHTHPGDWQPRNWLIRNGIVSVIDFGRRPLNERSSHAANMKVAAD
jgi:hypothetical protein